MGMNNAQSKSNMQPIRKFLPCIFLFLTIPLSTCQAFNTSVCSTFWHSGVYFTVNTQYTNKNIQDGSLIYNYCSQVQYYCTATHQVVYGSLIKLYGQKDCLEYNQKSVSLIEQKNVNKGIKIQYEIVRTLNNSDINKTITLVYSCEQTKKGCPLVESSTIFSFFRNNQLGFMITLEIIGVLFMVFGLYIYRASIVLLGACSMFFILLAIQLPIVFLPGVPNNLISNVLIVSGVCSFFAGYVFAYFPKAGIFMLGSWIGLIISLTLNNIAFYYIKSNPANLTLWIVLPILSVLFGVLSLFLRKTVIIFATSLIGAYMCLRALSWYLGAFPNQFLLARQFHLGLSKGVSWQFYLYVIALVILTASSSALQYWLFTKKSQLTNQSKDIDEQFNEIEAQLKAKRENLTQITNFKQIFVKPKGNPKVLKRNQRDSDVYDDEKRSGSQGNPKQQDEEIDEASQEKPAITKKELHKRFIIK